ncbi:MAG: class I SAM-dependent methyltransferase [Candidatus Binatia bacterium]|nr:class I SAM-dependent methyltransferase [Candidatus Binatia bacterium]
MSESASQGGLFTGERLHAGDPLFQADLARHVFAYSYAQVLARGKRVLDAGCGDGYGTALLAEVAEQAVGVDREARAIAAARQRYQRPNLRYEACSLEEVDKLGQTFDIICHFQVIEHLEDPKPFLFAAHKVLAKGGGLVITTPNRLLSRIENPYHVHEYIADELQTVLSSVFPRVEMFGIWGNDKVMAFEEARVRQARRILRLDPLGLRKHIPRSLVEWAYPRLARLVRRRIAQKGNPPIETSDFSIRRETSGALDLLAICYCGNERPTFGGTAHA